MADRLRASEPFKGVIADWKRKGGTSVVRISGRSVVNGRKEGMVFELFAEDVTERRALEQQLRQSQKMEAVGRLAGGIAHDFNNLLMVISGYSEFLLERLGNEPHLRGPAQEIAGAAERASSLTRQLLAFSRKQMLAPRMVNLNDIANSLKPVFLPGETLAVRIVKPGEEVGQGIGYLDDGTMIVVEGAREHIGKEVNVNVTSVLQTSAGRMIFGKSAGAPPARSGTA